MKKIYLASKSLRRKELLMLMGVDYEVLPIDISEQPANGESYLEYSTRICKEKSEAAWNHVIQNNFKIYPILTADTEVVLDNKIFGKPTSYNEAFDMLKKLSQNQHIVITSITLRYHNFYKTVTTESKVFFDKIEDHEINQYLKIGNYIDKAGAYGVQSFIGQFISKIDGCFYSIMGLPLNATKNLLKELEGNCILKKI